MMPKDMDILDVITVLSFFLGIENLNQNMAQSDKQELLDGVDNNIKSIIEDVHTHLQQQDDKIDLILKKLEGLK